MRIFGIVRLPRHLLNKSRLRIIFLSVIALSFFYHVMPKLLYKVPPTINSWQDPDFSLWRNSSSSEIVVLHWTALWRDHYGPRVLDAEQCSNLEMLQVQQINTHVFSVPCRISYDRRYLSRSDALVFHSFDLMWEALPKHHEPNQLWVYLQQESPIYTKLNLQDYPNTFNWTMTYRRDSDVYFPYGYVVPIANATTIDNRALVAKKKKLIAWIVSSCDSHSEREYLVEELRKFVHVSVFGWCGEDCPSLGGNCYKHVEKTHKFYLSFENSLCTDYITEKFWNALESGMVPVVYGGAKSEDYATIVPKDSYIDARAFASPKELATYLMYLDQNDEEYLKYFEWKNKYRVEHSPLGWCTLCQRLYEHRIMVPPPESKWYKDLWKWWNYMSYEIETMEAEENVESSPSQAKSIGQGESYKWDSQACLTPPKKLTTSESGSCSKPNLEPGVLNGRIFGKLGGWAKESLS